MQPIRSLLNKPYPLEERKPAQIKLALLFGGAVFLFILILNPFGNDTGNKTILLNALIAGLLTFITITLDFLILFAIFPRFFTESKWTVGRELIWTFIIIISIATTNMLAGSIFWGSQFSLQGWAQMIFYTALIGIAPATLSIILNQQRLLRRYKKETAAINETIAPETAIAAAPLPEPTAATPAAAAFALPAATITIIAENEKDNLTLSVSAFLAATSADNYIKVFYTQNDKLATAVLRSTLKKVEENTSLLPHIFRCHRTALVNLQAVKKLTGTAQGYRLQLPFLTEEIPVSRSLNAAIKEKLSAIHP